MAEDVNRLTGLLRGQPDPQISLSNGLRAAGMMGALSSVAGPVVLRDVYYNGKTVTLDGYRFEGCRFDNCTLQIHSTNFVIDRCVIDDSCVIQYGSSMVKVIQLFTSRYDWLADQLPSLAPRKHPNGSVSIGA